MSGTFVPIDSLTRPGGALVATVPPAEPPWFHLVPGDEPLALVVNGSLLFSVDDATSARLAEGDPEALRVLRDAVGGAAAPPPSPADDLREPVSLSLNLAQACNLSCSYCYADEGRFGGRARLMTETVALAAVDRLLDGAKGRRVTIGFIGGEPFLNRDVLHRCVEHATRRAEGLGVGIGFSVTTNATLLTPADLDLIRGARFAVSVSLDGDVTLNDRNRHARGDRSSGAEALAALGPLLDDPGGARLAARATVTRDDLRVAERVEALAGHGFPEVGVSPLRTGPDPSLVLRDDDWPVYLREMTRAADAEWDRVRAGGAFRFSNLAIALKELHRGSCRPLPCGAGAGYVSVSAEGHYFTCHRTVDDDCFRLGDAGNGPSRAARLRFLADRHVDRQEPCRSCWARYLCGGGCHAEVVAAGRSGCDFVRGWLEHCIRLYDRLATERPDLVRTAEED